MDSHLHSRKSPNGLTDFFEVCKNPGCTRPSPVNFSKFKSGNNGSLLYVHTTPAPTPEPIQVVTSSHLGSMKMNLSGCTLVTNWKNSIHSSNESSTDVESIETVAGPKIPIFDDQRGVVVITTKALETFNRFNIPNNQRIETSRSRMDLNKIHISYDPLDIIDQGSTSIIYRGTHGINPAAIKRIKSSLFDVYENELKLWQEMKRISQEENIHIVTLHNFWTEGEIERNHFFAMELAKCDLGKRIEQIRKEQEFQELDMQKEKIKGFIHDAAKGLKWIHDSGILHRDIKPENVLIFEKSCGAEIAKIGDFGVSRKLSGMSTGTNSCGRGTADWMAPEPLKAMRDKKKFYSTKAIDIFSLGMTAHFALSLGTHPFAETKKYGTFKCMNIMDELVRPFKLETVHHSANHLLQWMMDKESSFRPSIQQVLQHPFFWDYNKCLCFLVDVVRSVKLNDKTNRDLIQLREKIDQSYRERTELLKQETSWKLKIDARPLDLLLKRKTKGKKEYEGESLLMLVELIRDKHMHNDDMQPELLSDEFFGESGTFSDEKYMKFFHTIFPDMITFLFCELVNERNNPTVGILKKKYFHEFGNVPSMGI